MSFMLYKRATFVKTNSCLVATIVSFDTRPKILSLISVTLSHSNYLNQCFGVLQLLNNDANIVIK